MSVLWSVLLLFSWCRPAPEGRGKEFCLEAQMSDCREGDAVKGQRANQGYPISNNPQMFRNAERSDARPEAAVTWPFDPPQLFDGAVTWWVSRQKSKLGVRGAEQESLWTQSHVSFIGTQRQKKFLIFKQTWFHFFSLTFSSLVVVFYAVSVFRPGEALCPRWGLDSRTLTDELVEVRQKTPLQ